MNRRPPRALTPPHVGAVLGRRARRGLYQGVYTPRSTHAAGCLLRLRHYSLRVLFGLPTNSLRRVGAPAAPLGRAMRRVRRFSRVEDRRPMPSHVTRSFTAEVFVRGRAFCGVLLRSSAGVAHLTNRRSTHVSTQRSLPTDPRVPPPRRHQVEPRRETAGVAPQGPAGESNTTRAARQALQARIRGAENGARAGGAGGAGAGSGRGATSSGGHRAPGTRAIALERRTLDVYEELAAEAAGTHPRLVEPGAAPHGRNLGEVDAVSTSKHHPQRHRHAC